MQQNNSPPAGSASAGDENVGVTATTVASSQAPSASETTPLLPRASPSAKGGSPEQSAGETDGASVQSDAGLNDGEPTPTWREIMRLVRPFLVPPDFVHVVYITVAFITTLLRKVLNVISPLIFKVVVDRISENAVKPASEVKAPIMLILAYFGIGVLGEVIGVFQDNARERVILQVEQLFSVRAYEHLQNIGLSYHLDRKTGEVTSFVSRGASAVTSLFRLIFFMIAPMIFETLLVVGIFLKFGTAAIALVVFVTVTAYILFGVATTKVEADLSRSLNDSNDEVNAKEVETLLNYQTVTMFARNSDEIGEYNSLRNENKRRRIDYNWKTDLLEFAHTNIEQVGLCVALCMACYATVTGNPRLSAGDFLAVEMYINRLFQPFLYLEYFYKDIVRHVASLEKAAAVLRRSPQIVNAVDAHEWKPASAIERASQSEIEFRNVSFRYHHDPEQSSAGVGNVSFRVPPGKVVALVGPTGSGKSTIMRLALRLYDVDTGAVYVDGQDVRSLTQESLRRNIGIVAQETVLFNNTLRYNIAYGKPGATDAEVWAAARAAELADMIERQPERLKTKVGELGLKLSGGERQRVGIARCVIKNPAIFLFDEATSSLDSKTERAIQANLSEVCRNRTTLIIAHRLSTITKADEIILLNQGAVCERGSHKELLARDGQYARLWRMNQGE